MAPNRRIKHVHLTLEPRPDPPKADEFYCVCGKVIIRWGLFENQIDWTLRSIVSLPGSASIRPRLADGSPIPAAWKRKSELWRKSFRHLPDLAPIRNHAIGLIDTANQAVAKRHAIIHGHWNEFRDDKTGFAIVGYHFKQAGPELTVEEIVIRLHGLYELAATIDSLREAIAPVFNHIFALQSDREPL